MSADEIPSNMVELLAKDWNDVLRHAKGMQLAINRFTTNLELAVNEGHDSRSKVAQDVAFYGIQLSTVGDQALEFVESIEKGVEPLAKALVAEPSDEGAALITKTLAIAQTSAIRALGIAILDTAESSRPDGTSLITENELNADDEFMTPASAAPVDRPTSGGFSYDEEMSSTSEIRIQTINPVPETIKDHGQSPNEPIDVDSL